MQLKKGCDILHSPKSWCGGGDGNQPAIDITSDIRKTYSFEEIMKYPSILLNPPFDFVKISPNMETIDDIKSISMVLDISVAEKLFKTISSLAGSYGVKTDVGIFSSEGLADIIRHKKLISAKEEITSEKKWLDEKIKEKRFCIPHEFDHSVFLSYVIEAIDFLHLSPTKTFHGLDFYSIRGLVSNNLITDGFLKHICDHFNTNCSDVFMFFYQVCNATISPDIIQLFKKKSKDLIKKMIVFLRVVEVTIDKSVTEVHIGDYYDGVNDLRYYANHYTSLIFDVEEKVVTYFDSRGKKEPCETRDFLSNIKKEFFDGQFDFVITFSHIPEKAAAHTPDSCKEKCDTFFPLQICDFVCGIAVTVVAVIAAIDIHKFRIFSDIKQDFPLKYLKAVSLHSDFLRLIILKWVCTGIFKIEDLLPHVGVDCSNSLDTNKNIKRHKEPEEQEEKTKRQKIELEEKVKSQKIEQEEKAKRQKIEQEEKAKSQKIEQEEKAKSQKIEQEEKAKSQKIEQEEKAKSQKIEQEEIAKRQKIECEKWKTIMIKSGAETKINSLENDTNKDFSIIQNEEEKQDINDDHCYISKPVMQKEKIQPLSSKITGKTNENQSEKICNVNLDSNEQEAKEICDNNLDSDKHKAELTCDEKMGANEPEAEEMCDKNLKTNNDFSIFFLKKDFDFSRLNNPDLHFFTQYFLSCDSKCEASKYVSICQYADYGNSGKPHIHCKLCGENLGQFNFDFFRMHLKSHLNPTMCVDNGNGYSIACKNPVCGIVSPEAHFHCLSCQKLIKRKFNFIRHILKDCSKRQNKEKNPNVPVVSCRLCKIQLNRKNLKVHIFRKHGIDVEKLDESYYERVSGPSRSKKPAMKPVSKKIPSTIPSIIPSTIHEENFDRNEKLDIYFLKADYIFDSDIPDFYLSRYFLSFESDCQSDGCSSSSLHYHCKLCDTDLICSSSLKHFKEHLFSMHFVKSKCILNNDLFSLPCRNCKSCEVEPIGSNRTHYHCAKCKKTFMRRDYFERHIKRCTKEGKIYVEENQKKVKFSKVEENEKKVKFLRITDVSCILCGLILRLKNFKTHISRKHNMDVEDLEPLYKPVSEASLALNSVPIAELTIPTTIHEENFDRNEKLDIHFLKEDYIFESDIPDFYLSRYFLSFESNCQSDYCSSSSLHYHCKLCDTELVCASTLQHFKEHLIFTHFVHSKCVLNNDLFSLPCRNTRSCDVENVGRTHYHCAKCKKTVVRKTNFERHINICTGERILDVEENLQNECFICGLSMPNRNKLKHHIRDEHHPPEKVLDENFDINDELEIYFLRKDYRFDSDIPDFYLSRYYLPLDSTDESSVENLQYQCKLCDKSALAFKDIKLFKIHLVQVHINPLLCVSGIKGYSVPCRNSSCMDAFRSHYHCMICPKIVVRKNNFERHVKTCTGDTRLNTISCQVCGLILVQKNLRRHMERQHQILEKRSVCVDKERGIFLVPKYGKGVQYPCHVQKQILDNGLDKKIFCDYADCKKKLLEANLNNDFDAECKHMACVSLASYHELENVSELDENVLSLLGESGLFKKYSSSILEHCKKLNRVAKMNNSATVVPWKSNSTFTHFSVFEEDQHKYSLLNRVAVTFNSTDFSLICGCTKKSALEPCVHKAIAFWYLVQTKEIEKPLECEIDEEEIEEISKLEKTVKYVYSEKHYKPEDLKKGFDVRNIPNEITPPETVCFYCKKSILVEHLVCGNAMILTIQGCFGRVKVYEKVCKLCETSYRYQEAEHGIHNFDNTLFLGLDLCELVRINLQSNVNIADCISSVISLFKCDINVQKVIDAYLMYDVLSSSPYEFYCNRCGYHPATLIMQVQKKCFYNFDYNQFNTKDPKHPRGLGYRKVDCKKFWEDVELSVLSKGFSDKPLFNVKPNLYYWSPYLGPHTRTTKVLYNTEIDKELSNNHHATKQVSDDVRYAELFNKKCKKVLTSIARECNISTKGRKQDIVSRLEMAMLNEPSGFEKINKSIMNHSGGLLTFHCEHNICYYMKFVNFDVGPRDYLDGLLSMKHFPNVSIVDTAHLLARHGNHGQRDHDIKTSGHKIDNQSLFSPFEGRLSNNNDLQSAKEGTFRKSLPWLLVKESEEEEENVIENCHPLTQNSSHYCLSNFPYEENATLEKEILRGIKFVPELQDLMNDKQGFTNGENRVDFYTGMEPAIHIYMNRSFMNHRNFDINNTYFQFLKDNYDGEIGQDKFGRYVLSNKLFSDSDIHFDRTIPVPKKTLFNSNVEILDTSADNENNDNNENDDNENDDSDNDSENDSDDSRSSNDTFFS